MRSFKNIAELVRAKRVSHRNDYSQLDLAISLGYKNGQLISNIERGLCGIPLKMMNKISEVLDIDPDELKATILRDHEETLTKYFIKKSILKEAA